MRVRRARPSDAAAIAGVHVRAWRAAYRGLLPDAVLDGLSVETRAGAWRRLLDSGEVSAWVAEDDDALVGFCSVAGAEITALYVEPERWRRGAGRALVGAARDAIAGDALAWVLESNEAALAAYRALGFAPDGERKREPVAGLPSGESPPQVRVRAPATG